MLAIDRTTITLERIKEAREKVEKLGTQSRKNSDFFSPLWWSDCAVIMTALDRLGAELEKESSEKDETSLFEDEKE